MCSYKSIAVCAKGGAFSSVLKPLPSSACITDCVVVHFPGAELDNTRPPMRVQGRNREKKNSVLKVSKSEFGLIKGLLYSSKSQNLHGTIPSQKRGSWFWKGNFDQNVPNVSLKCLVLP